MIVTGAAGLGLAVTKSSAQNQRHRSFKKHGPYHSPLPLTASALAAFPPGTQLVAGSGHTSGLEFGSSLSLQFK